ncbi:hypothetical protein COV20_02515 [Candidatus Woesearchaeota archaeon CG10_big_fil_rev_8_21_14_0_10_45_16]|nr:MAG: hypothetical protein COV20_02515 [Candidatus Woesearchaeota archaeon CG10_big_fil_rev_8_21_14_0_10_45_16]
MAAPPVPQPSFDSAKLYVWVKSLEGKVNNLLREVDILKTDFIQRTEKMKKELKSFNDDFLELKRDQEAASQKMDLVIKELKRTAGIEEITTMKKYLEYWNPMTFVTQQDLNRALDARMSKPQQKT